MVSIINAGQEDGIKNQIDLWEYLIKWDNVPAIDEYWAYMNYAKNGKNGGVDGEKNLNGERDHVFDKSQGDQTGGRTTFYLQAH